MKTILLISSLIAADGDGSAAAETTAEYASQKACIQAVEIRTGYMMQPVKGGMRLQQEIDTRYGKGRMIFVCSPYGSAADE
ncbi:hypothetical protein D3C81_176840 [compost metagenome]